MDTKVTPNWLLISWFRLVTHFTHANFKIPSVDKRFVIEQVATESTPPEECREFERISSKNSRHIFILLTYNVVYVIKALIGMWALRSTFNNYDHETTIKYLISNEHQFSCVATNCTKILTGHSLARDLGAMPLFSVCYPTLSSLSAPVVHLEALAMLAFALAALGSLLTGFVIPARQIFSPISAETLMFMLTPFVITRMTRDRVIKCIAQVKESYINYLKQPINWSRRASGGGSRTRVELATERVYGWRTESDYLDDCIPLVRSSWWRAQLARMMLINNLIFAGANLFFTVLVVAYINFRVADRTELVSQMAMNISKLGCGIWELEDDDRKIIDFVDVATVNLKWPTYAIIETMVILVMPVVCAAIFVGYIHAVAVELNCWLGELQHQLLLSIEMIEISRLPTCERINSNYEPKELRMAELRRDFAAAADILFISQIRSHKLIGVDLKSRLARQKYFLDLVRANKIHVKSEVEILGKTYVNLRLLIKNVSLLTPITSTIIMGAYMLNFGAAIIAIWLSRNLKDFTKEPAAVIFFAWSLSNFFVFICANFHAKAKRLHNLIWQLVARMSAARGTHIEHLAVLWERQISQLDMDNGLCLKASKFRITYVNMLQMMISTATILVMATNH